MNWTPLYIIPGLTVLFWAVVHALLCSRTHWFRYLFLTQIAVFFTAAGDVLGAEVFGSSTVAHIILQLTAPATIPLTALYFAHLHRDFKYKPVQIYWIVIPVMLFTASILLTGINGLDETDAFISRLHSGRTGEDLFYNANEHAFYISTVVVFRIVMAVETVAMLIYCAYLAKTLHFHPRHLAHFFSNKRWRIRVLEIQVSLAVWVLLGLCAKIFLHLSPLMHPSSTFNFCLVLVMTILQFFFGFFALFGSKEFVSRSEIDTSFRFNYRKETASTVAEEVIMDMMGQLEGESLSHVLTRLEVHTGAGSGKGESASLSTALLGKTRHDDSLMAQFQQLMMGEQLFLRPGLTLSDVAVRLKTNKTYVSKMVNQTYNLGFPEVLNILRVDYAETYIRKHPDVNQEDIAKACGFLSASSFNSTFKRITGYTPKVWAARISSGQ